jgi:hypothetical protein
MVRAAVDLDHEGVSHQEVNAPHAGDLNLAADRPIAPLDPEPNPGLRSRLAPRVEVLKTGAPLAERHATDEAPSGRLRDHTTVDSRLEHHEPGLDRVVPKNVIEAVRHIQHGHPPEPSR